MVDLVALSLSALLPLSPIAEGGAAKSSMRPCEEVRLTDLNESIADYSKLVADHGPTGDEARTVAAAIAGHYGLEGELDEAQKWYDMAFRGPLGPPRSIQEAAVYQGLGWTLRRAGQTEKAVSYLSRAASAWRELLGPDSVCEGIARERLANCFLASGRYEDALAEYSESMRILAQSLGEESSPYLQARHGFANTLAFLGRLEEALPHYLAVSETRHRLLARDDQRLGWICHDLALALHGLGRFLDAQPLYREAMEIRKHGDPELYRQSAAGLASCLTNRGDFLGARQVLEEVLQSLDSEDDPDPHGIAVAFQSLAFLHLRMDDFDEARRLYQSVIGTLGEELDDYPHLEGLTVSGLAQIAQHNGETSVAATLQRRVLHARERLYGKESVFVCIAQGRLAAILAEAGHARDAEELFRESLSRLATYEDEARFAYGDISQDYARMLWKRGKNVDAAAWMDTTLSAFATALPLGHAKRIRARETAGEIYLAAGNLPRAWEEALIAEEEGRRLLLMNIRGMSEATALLYKQTAPRGVPVLLRLLVGSPTAERVQTVWEALIRSRNAVGEELATRRRAARTPETQALWDTICDERQHLGNLYAQAPSPEMGRAYVQTVDELEQHVERLEEQLALLSPTPTSETSVTLQTLQEALAEHSALVAIVRYPETLTEDPKEAYGALVLRADRSAPQFIPLCAAETLQTLVARLQRHMEAAPLLLRLDPEETEAEYRAIGAELRSTVWDPLAQVLAGLDRIYLVPDGDTWRISLSALPDDDGGYLVESSPAIHVIGSETDLVTAGRSAPRPGILIVGGVDYDGCLGKAASLAEPRPSGRPAFHTLPNSAQEALSVASIWTESPGNEAEPVTELLGAKANEGNMTRYAERVGIIHLATHGFLPSNTLEQPRIKQSRWAGIALAGANTGGCSADEDGIFTASELAMLDLDAVRLVFLSSCGSGLGTLVPTEGIVGFQRSLRVAGCQSMVLTLWDVPDRPTREWVERFYTHYVKSNISAADAFRMTCTETLDLRRSLGRSTHPFYWGGFAVIGAAD